MDQQYYLRKLGLKPPSSIDEVRRAYRKKARLYHPDLNDSPDAPEKFIEATEAYDYLISHFENKNNLERKQAIYDEWVKYRKQEVREKARRYAGQKYSYFKSSSYYKTSSPDDIPRIIYNLIISLFIIFAAVYGYAYRLAMVKDGYEKPTLTGFLGLLLIGLIFFGVSVLYLISFVNVSKVRKKVRNEKNKKPI